MRVSGALSKLLAQVHGVRGACVVAEAWNVDEPGGPVHRDRLRLRGAGFEHESPNAGVCCAALKFVEDATCNAPSPPRRADVHPLDLGIAVLRSAEPPPTHADRFAVSGREEESPSGRCELLGVDRADVALSPVPTAVLGLYLARQLLHDEIVVPNLSQLETHGARVLSRIRSGV